MEDEGYFICSSFVLYVAFKVSWSSDYGGWRIKDKG
jgi:hypothetical protein